MISYLDLRSSMTNIKLTTFLHRNLSITIALNSFQVRPPHSNPPSFLLLLAFLSRTSSFIRCFGFHHPSQPNVSTMTISSLKHFCNILSTEPRRLWRHCKFTVTGCHSFTFTRKFINNTKMNLFPSYLVVSTPSFL